MAEPTEAEKQKVLETQQRLDQLERQASAPNPGGSPQYLESIPKDSPNYRAYVGWQQSTAAAKEKLPQVQAEYNTLISNPALAEYAKEHPATQYEVKRFAVSATGFDRAAQPDRARNPNDIDLKRTQMIEGIARANPSFSIQEVSKEYNVRSGNLNPPNVEIDYSGTLAARAAGYNVGSALYNNLAPTFQKEEDKRFAEKNKFIGLTENITTEKPTAKPPTRTAYTVGLTETLGGERTAQPKAYGISLTEGAPREPRKLSQAEVNKLSASEYAIYKSEYDQYNAYIKSQNEKIKAENKKAKIEGLTSWVHSKGILLTDIETMKKEGVKEVTILTKGKSETVPIDRAFLSIVSKSMSKKPEDQIVGIFTPPVIPKGYEVAGVNLTGEGFTEYGSNPVGTILVREIPKPEAKKEQTGEEFWSGFVGKVGQRAGEITSDRSQNPVARTFAAGGQVAAEIGGGLISIGGEISRIQLPDIRKAAGELFNGTASNQTQTNQTEGLPLGYISDRTLNQTVPEQAPPVTPSTAPGALLTGLSSGVIAAVSKGDAGLIAAGAQRGVGAFESIARKQGILPTAVQTALYVDPIAWQKAIPFRSTSLVVPVGRGIGRGVTGEIESLTMARQIKLGYGKQLGRVGIGYANGKFFMGLPKPSALPLERITYTAERGGYRITEGPSGVYMTKPQTLEQLVKIGKIRPEEAAQITRQKEGLKITEKIPDKPLRTTLSPTGKEQPQASLLPGKETALVDEIVLAGQKRYRDTLPAEKGSVINQYFSLNPRQRRDTDIDLGMTGWSLEKQERIASKESKKISEDLNKLGGRTFSDKGGSVESPTGKVIEFVTEKDSLNYQRVFKTDPDLVMGFKAPKDSLQITEKTPFMLTYRFQGVRKVSSILELGGDAPKPEGVSLGTSRGREKDFFDVVDYYETKASQASPEDAARLRQIAQQTKDYAKSIGQWSDQKPMDLGDVTEFSDVKPDNILRSIGTGAKKTSQYGGSTGVKGLTIQKEPEPRSTGIKSESRSISGKYQSPSVSIKSGSKYDSIGSKSQGREFESVGYTQSKSTADSPSLSSVSVSGKYARSVEMPSPSAKTSPSSPSRSTGAGKYGALVGSPSAGRSPSPSSPGSPGTGITPNPSPGSPGSPGLRSLTGKPLVPLESIPRTPRTPNVPRFEAKVSTTKRERRERQDKVGADFLGNSRVADVLSFRTKETDITYGRSKIVGLVSRDVTKSGRGNFTNNRSGSLLKKDKGSIRKVSKKKWAL